MPPYIYNLSAHSLIHSYGHWQLMMGSLAGPYASSCTVMLDLSICGKHGTCQNELSHICMLCVSWYMPLPIIRASLGGELAMGVHGLS